MARRIHVLGASGTGTSTLARGLADALGAQAFDTDDFYWRPSDPPFRTPRPVHERLTLMEQLFLPRADWILAGSFSGWGDPVIPHLSHVVFLDAPAPVRLARLRARERLRRGSAIAPGGVHEAAYRSFLDWAMSYDDSTTSGRSRRAHEDWMARLPCPVLRLDAAQAPAQVLKAAMAALDPARPAA